MEQQMISPERKKGYDKNVSQLCVGKSSMPFENRNLTVSELREKLNYDPETGVFLWKVAPARNIRAGATAGCTKASRTKGGGDVVAYRYIRLGHEVPAGRVAWAMHYGEWPLSKLLFVDGDTLNLRIENLREANSLLAKYDRNDPEQRKAYLRDHREAFPKVWKDTYLRRDFGIDLAQYASMAAAQDNKCAICREPETQMRGGKVKALAVDHDHTAGHVRGLLCSDCNTGLGKLKDSRSVLLAAIKYLDKHAASPNVVSLDAERVAT